MPINLTEIFVNTFTVEDQLEDNPGMECCTLCRHKLEANRSSDYNPIPHTLDICLNNIIEAGAIRPVLGELKARGTTKNVKNRC